MQFKDVIGQKEVKNVFCQMVQSERIPHAQIFLGPEGCGKLALAIAFASYVLCENKQAEDACGECPACQKTAKLIHPDLHFSYPTVGSKATSTLFLKEWRSALKENSYQNAQQWLQYIQAENKQGNITKDECRDIVRKLSLKTFEGSHKILIIWLPEYLGKEGNRLLKLIEEPPDKTLFILVAENQELILNTILSRCQLVGLQALSDDELVQALVTKGVATAEEAGRIAHLANGSLNEAMSLVGKTDDEQGQKFLAWFRLCYVGNGADLVNWVDQFSRIGREPQKHFLRYGLFFLREYLLIKAGSGMPARLRDRELKAAENMTKLIEFDQLEGISALLNDCIFAIERYGNPKVLLLDTSIKVHKLLKRKSLYT